MFVGYIQGNNNRTDVHSCLLDILKELECTSVRLLLQPGTSPIEMRNIRFIDTTMCSSSLNISNSSDHILIIISLLGGGYVLHVTWRWRNIYRNRPAYITFELAT